MEESDAPRRTHLPPQLEIRQSAHGPRTSSGKRGIPASHQIRETGRKPTRFPTTRTRKTAAGEWQPVRASRTCSDLEPPGTGEDAREAGKVQRGRSVCAPRVLRKGGVTLEIQVGAQQIRT